MNWTKRLLAAGLLITAQGAKASVTDLAFLSGCWENEHNGELTEERWDSGRGGLMLGTSKTVANGTAKQFEFLRIREEKGDVIYSPYIDGVPASEFVLSSVDKAARLATFSNPANPFPKLIQYWRTQNDELSITLSGAGPAISYTLKKTDCSK
jgi:hypothetical protein